MKLIASVLAVLAAFCILLTPHAFAQQPQPTKQEYTTAKVVSVIKEGEREVLGHKNFFQIIEVKILDGKDKGKTITIESGTKTTLAPNQKVEEEQTIILTKLDEKTGYQVYDVYRVTTLLYFTLLFFVTVIVIAGLKGFGSLIGLFISLAVILLYIVPQIVAGSDPLLASMIGAMVILLSTTYTAHGFSTQTTVALVSTFIALALTAFFSMVFVEAAHIVGFTEDTSVLQFGLASEINFKGLLLGGTIIGALGALNDVTTTQAAAVFEFAKSNTKLTFDDLFTKGFLIGKEHVVSMVNTLMLAYAGSSLTLFIFFVLNPQHVPWWVILNSEEISDEIVRMIAGGMGLLFVVPIVTILASIVASRKSNAR